MKLIGYLATWGA